MKISKILLGAAIIFAAPVVKGRSEMKAVVNGNAEMKAQLDTETYCGGYTDGTRPRDGV